MRILLFVFLFVFADASPGYSESSTGNDIGQGGSGGHSFGYAGSFSGAGAPGGNIPFPAFPQFDFSGFFTNYLQALNRQHQEFINQIQKLSQAQAQAGNYAPNYQTGYDTASGGGDYGLGNRGGFVGGYGGGFSGPDGQAFTFSGPLGGGGGGDNAAFASGSIGPGGVHQTASVYPENPGAPNVNTRFGANDGGNGGGFKSVFTSSKSVSTNIDGKPQNFREASTTVNDNGKVTTYTAHNP